MLESIATDLRCLMRFSVSGCWVRWSDARLRVLSVKPAVYGAHWAWLSKTHVVIFCVCLFSCSMSSEALKENQGAVRMNSCSEAACDIFALEQTTGRPSILRQSQAENISRTVPRGAKVGFLEFSKQLPPFFFF